MMSRLCFHAVLLPVCVVVSHVVFATSVLADDFTNDIRPILKQHCFGCHGAKVQKGELRIDRFAGDLSADRREAERWHDILGAIRSGEMPPPDAKQLSPGDLARVTHWIDQSIDQFVASQKSTGRRVLLRRLTRTQYQNTMRDLLGIDADYARNLPPEGLSEDGFRNNGRTLRMSDMQLEYYLDAARSALRTAITTGDAPDVVRHAFDESVTDKGRGSSLLNDDEQFVVRFMEYPSAGEIVLRVKARAKLVEGRGFPQLRAAIGYRADVQAPRRFMDPIDVSSEEWQTFEFRGRIEQFPLPSKTQSKFPGLLVWLDNVYAEGASKPLKPKRPKKKKRKKRKEKADDGTSDAQLDQGSAGAPPSLTYPLIEVASLEFVGPVFEAWPPAHHSAIVPAGVSSDDDGEFMHKVLQPFATRAFRRPVSDQELAPFMDFYADVRPTVPTWEDAVRETLAMVLISPEFLYLFEPATGQERGLTDFELASRLSYFLWNTMPDDDLFAVARSGALRQPERLRQEVDRMLADPRSRGFVEQFAGQWLDVDAIDRVAINPEFYPDFDNSLKPSLRGETFAFFGEVFHKRLSALNFLDSDFVMLNEPLAKHYGLDGPRGSAFERVELADDDHRGGVLAQASVLLGNSTGDDSHVVKRAVWIRERLLHDPPADPPPNVPNLDSTDPNFASLPVREQLRLHREESACTDCHRGIDPWGIALEHFGADGLWRDEILRKHPKRKRMTPVAVEAKTTLPDGSSIDGLAELKAWLLEHRRDQFAHAFTSKLLAYGLGRSLELADTAVTEELTGRFVKSDYRIDALIHAIVQSDVFRMK